MAKAVHGFARHLSPDDLSEGAAALEQPLVLMLGEAYAQAAALLRDRCWRGHGIATIAYHCGFNAPAHFSRTFATRFGCSPKAWWARDPRG